MRMFGLGIEEYPFKERLKICKSLYERYPEGLPRCIRSLINLLFQEDSCDGSYPVVTWLGIPPPSAHQLLQPHLNSTLIPFPPLFGKLYTSLAALQGFTKTIIEIQATPADTSPDTNSTLVQTLCELKVKSLGKHLEYLVDGSEACLEIIIPYVLEMLTSPFTDVLAAWYLFDHVARALGPSKTAQVLLEPIVNLYDWDRPRDPRTLQKRVKLYHRSFLIRLIVRFGMATFLNSFIVPLVEAVGGYHDLDQPVHSHLNCCEVEECLENDTSNLLSPLDEDSSAESERSQSNTFTPDKTSEVEVEPEVFSLDEDIVEESSEKGPQSAISLQNLLIDNVDTQVNDEKEENRQEDPHLRTFSETSESSWAKKAFTGVGLKHFRAEHDHSDLEYSKLYVNEVCEVSGESVVWLGHRLGPVLTARHLSRNLLRMLGLCYSGSENLTRCSQHSIVGDSNASHVLRCLSSIAALYGEQLVVVQYFSHMADLIVHCKRKMTSNLEGALIGCLSLLSRVLGLISDPIFSECFQDVILKTIIHPSLRIMATCSANFPSGVTGRSALALKLLISLITLMKRAQPQEQILLLQTIQKFFMAFSKAYEYNEDERGFEETEGDLARKSRSKDEVFESPCGSFTSALELESLRQQCIKELKGTLNSEFAFVSYVPFVNFFGESAMEQNLRNYDLIKRLCSEYKLEKEAAGRHVPGACDMEPFVCDNSPPVTPSHIGSFSNVIVVGNRIDIQEPAAKSATSSSDGDSRKSKTNEQKNRHLHGNWLAYWEHELGRSSKDSKLNIKQIKLQTFSGHSNNVKHIVPLASENSFMSAGRDKTVRLWSLRSQGGGNHISQPQWTYTGHKKAILALGFIERMRLTVSCDSVVHLWDPFIGRIVANCEQLRSLPINTLRVLHPPSTTVLCATTDTTLRSLDARTCTFVSEMKVSMNPGGLIRCLVVSPNSTWIAVGQATGVLTVLNATMGTILSSWKAHDAEILQLVALDENTLLSSSLDQVVSVWNVHDGKLQFVLKGPTEPVHCLDVCCGEVISGTTANRIGVHTCINSNASFSSTRLRSDTFKGVLTSMAILPLNRLLLLGADSGNITLLC